MINKTDYENYVPIDRYTEGKKYIQLILDSYCSDSEQFRVVEDITPESWGDFLKIVLKQYQCYNIHRWCLHDLAEALWFYSRGPNPEEWRFYEFPVYPVNDRRNLAILINNCLESGNTMFFPEEVPKLIEFLDTPNGNALEVEKVIEQYLDQFDDRAREEEYDRRWKAITNQRLEEITFGGMFPIKPMNIELDLCYKKSKPNKENLPIDKLAESEQHIQHFIDLYCFDSQQFKVVGDITLNNCGDFWKVILKQYQCYNINPDYLDSLSNALATYLGDAYQDDRHNLTRYIDRDKKGIIFPEEVPKLMEFLDVPSGSAVEAGIFLDQYFSQFSYYPRCVELSRRWRAIQKDRLMAVARHEPLPIKPMNIELYLCYKTPEN